MICAASVVLSGLPMALESPLVISSAVLQLRVSPKPYKIQLLVSVLSTGF